MLSRHQLVIIADLVVAGGKSPQTGVEGMKAAAMALMWIEQALSELPASPAAYSETGRAAEGLGARG